MAKQFVPELNKRCRILVTGKTVTAIIVGRFGGVWRVLYQSGARAGMFGYASGSAMSKYRKPRENAKKYAFGGKVIGTLTEEVA
jgi:hypothetical protein